MRVDLSKLTPGLEVRGPHARHVGEIKELDGDQLIVSRTLQPEVAVPLTAVQEVTAEAVILDMTTTDVDDEWWAHAGEDVAVDTRGEYD